MQCQINTIWSPIGHLIIVSHLNKFCRHDPKKEMCVSWPEMLTGSLIYRGLDSGAGHLSDLPFG